MNTSGFAVPPYPHDRLNRLTTKAIAVHGSVIDLSIGTPCDRPPDVVLEVMADADSAKGYPPSGGMAVLKEAVTNWFSTRFGVNIDSDTVGLCVGTKEFVAGLPHWLNLRSPARDTVLYPAVSYPTYAMGAALAGCRAVPVAIDAQGYLDLAGIDPEDVSRALCLWSNSPSNPTGALDGLKAVADWGRAVGVPVFSDECYNEFIWDASGSRDEQYVETILQCGLEGVIAVNSLSKRSNMAGLRAGFFAGDPELVDFLTEIRKHSGLMVPGPVQLGAAAALSDQTHVEQQRQRYVERLEFLVDVLSRLGLPSELPSGGFYLWLDSGDEGGWPLTERLALDHGLIVSPGEFYGPVAHDHVRVAAVQPMDVLSMLLKQT